MSNYQKWGFRGITYIYCVCMFLFADYFRFMSLNVFLAYIPIELSFHFKKMNTTFFLGAVALWLLFYPNAPYLLTDFFHLERLNILLGNNQVFELSISGWWYFCLLSFGIVVYYFWGLLSFVSFLDEVKKRFTFWNPTVHVGLIFLVNFLSSLAIFVGRFDRLHSIHLFTEPIQTLQLVFFSWSLEKLIFIGMFTLLQILMMYLIINRTKVSKTEI